MPILFPGWKCVRSAAIFAAILAVCRVTLAQPGAGPQEGVRQADAAFHAGYAAAERGDLAAARTAFQTVVELTPEIPEGHSALGSVLLQLGQYVQAIPELERALALKADDHSAQLNLAIASEQARNYTRSVALFEALDGQSGIVLPSSALISYARALNGANQPDQALTRLQKGATDNPADAPLHDALGSLYAQRQSWSLAQAQFEQAIGIDGGLPEAHLHLGITLVAEERTADAIRELTVASGLFPENPSIPLELGRALIANGEYEKAIAVLEKAVALAQGSAPLSGSTPPSTPLLIDAKYQLALALQGSGQEEQSIPLFQQVTAAQPRNAPALTNLALALVQTGKSKEAIPLYQRALAETSNDPLVHQDLGVAYLQQSNLDDAIREFRAGLQLAPGAYELHYNLGLALKLKDDVPGAAAELEQAAHLNPNSPDPPYTLGILYMQTGRFDEAVTQLKTTLQLRPENGDAWALLGSVYKQQNNLPEATKALRKAVRLLPNQPGSHITLAGVLAQQGEKEEAAAERKLASDLTRTAVNRQRATFAVNSGRLLLQQGKISDAIERFQEAATSDPTYIEGHRGLAEAFSRSGRAADAESERQKVAQLEKVQP